MDKEKLAEQLKKLNLDALPSLDQINAERCRRSLKLFITEFWQVLEPSAFQDGIHVDALCTHLEKIFEIKRLIINIAPRHTKSLIVSVFLPIWMWLTDPTLRFICCSYSLNISQDASIKSRRILESEKFKRYYGHMFTLKDDQNTIRKFENSKGGERLATAVGASTLGSSGDVVIFDDPNDIQTINSEIERHKVITFYRDILSSRLNFRPDKAARILVQQRCHPNDLSGYIYEQDEGDWCRLILPFEFDPERRCVTPYWTDPRKRKGDLLSKRLPKDEIRIEKANKGNASWEALYNQLPMPEGAGVFDREQFRYFKPEGSKYDLDGRIYKLRKDCWRFVTVDLAISQTTQSDYTVFAVIDVSPAGDMILVHVQRDKMASTTILGMFQEINEAYKPIYFLVEQTGMQQFVIEQARLLKINVLGVKPGNLDKLARALPLEIRFEAGQVWFPKSKAWLTELEKELLMFPNGKHDDQTDCLAYASSEISKRHRAKPEPIKLTPEQEAEKERKQRWEALTADAN